MTKAAKTTKTSSNTIEQLREGVVALEKELIAKGTYTPEARVAIETVMGLIDKYR